MLSALREKSLHFLLIIVLILVIGPPRTFGMNDAEGEYEIKAGLLYKFLLFAEWPDEAFSKDGGAILLCILGEDPSKDTFAPVEGDTINGRRLIIHRIQETGYSSALKKCHLVFIGASLRESLPEILQSLEGHPALTVSEIDGFGEQGGMINFIIKDDFVRFEINQQAAENAGIRIRSKLLRVADRIVNGNHG